MYVAAEARSISTISSCFPALFQTRYAGKLWKGFGKAGFPPALNDPDKILYDSSSCDLPDAIQKLKKVTVTEDISLYTTQKYENFTFDKFLVFPTAESDRQEFRKFADQHFTCFVHEDAAWELAQKSHSKATGIQFLADYLGASIENTYAFGDSTNDLPMLKYAKTSIAMGNSNPLILPYCTYQTTPIEEDGIANALKHFHLI